LAREFYDRWIGASGFLSVLGRLVFKLSGVVYSKTFVQQARLTPRDKVLELGCGFGTILRNARRRTQAEQNYVGIDLSYQMIWRAQEKSRKSPRREQIQFFVGSAIALPLKGNLFDVVLLSHVIKYLTDEQLIEVLSEAKRVLKARGRIIVWEFSPYVSPGITRCILRNCKAQRLRAARELRDVLKECGYQELCPFEIRTPWLPWRNVAFSGRVCS
jgi:ubiquinone/menaquinone biosynthesis C-methylase UbiE